MKTDKTKGNHISLKEITSRIIKTEEDKELFNKELRALRLSVQIAELRKKHGLSQKQFASRLHVRQQCVSRMETENALSVSVNTLIKIAKALHKHLVIDFR
ncbi:MAG: helix-turn-helix transcriptional regulator [Elusimicrobia bacterium]|nr:helix-turn-helix transcriptional regulator [Elusimicrobiota bacterium]